MPVLISIGLLVYAYGCEPTTTSLINPNLKVNSSQLNTEFEILLLQHEQRTQDIDRQFEIRNMLFQQGLTIVQNGSINPIGLITAIIAFFGIGTAIDDLRLRKKLKEK